MLGAATSGIGVLRRTGSAVLKLQLDAHRPKAQVKQYRTQNYFH